MKLLVITEPAEDDLEAITDYIAQDNPVAAEDVYLHIKGAAKSLPEHPSLGRSGRVPGTRELSISDLPYLMVYAVDSEAVTILAIFHTSRDLARVFRDRISES